MITITDEEIREEKKVCRWNSNIVDLIYSLKKYEISSKKKKKKSTNFRRKNNFYFSFCYLLS